MDKHEITIANIDKVLKYLPIFEQENFKGSEWVSPGEAPDGAFYLPMCRYDDKVGEFRYALGDEGFIKPFDWSAWQDEAQKYCLDPELLKTADLETIIKLFTTHVRKERFCEGHFSCMIESGHITAILHRLKEIRDEMEKGK